MWNWLKAAAAKVNGWLNNFMGWLENTRTAKYLEAWEYDPPPLPLSKLVRYGLVVALMLVGVFWWGRWTAPVDGPKYAIASPMSEPLPRPANPDVRLMSDNAKLEQENAALKKAYIDMAAIAKAKHERLLLAEKELSDIRKARPMSEDNVVETKPKTRVVYVRVKEKTFLCEAFNVCN
jgi:hypothetical protein